MGILNVTPDSFSDGGHHLETETAVAHGLEMTRTGADIIDVGGESTRPGADPVPLETERERVIPVVAALAEEGVVVSVDTTKPEMAADAIAAGAEIINDTTAASHDGMAEVMAEGGTGVILMHMQGTPRTMQQDPRYDDVVREVRDYLVARAELVLDVGVAAEAVAVDPGLGFGKTLDHNLELMRSLGELVVTGFPVVVGASRKAFLGRLTDAPVASERLAATVATTALAVAAGVACVRVHDVAASRQAADVAWAIATARD